MSRGLKPRVCGAWIVQAEAWTYLRDHGSRNSNSSRNRNRNRNRNSNSNSNRSRDSNSSRSRKGKATADPCGMTKKSLLAWRGVGGVDPVEDGVPATGECVGAGGLAHLF